MRLYDIIARALGEAEARRLPTQAQSIEITDVCDDSRRAGAGSLFVAVPGTRMHSSVFANDAVKRGAAAVVADHDAAIDTEAIVIRTGNSREAVSRIASVFFGLDRVQQDGFRVIGITGTNGKSTIAHMIRAMLQAAGHKVGILGTIEYDLISRRVPADLTTPGPITLTKHLVEAHEAGASYAVMEASSHSLDQRRTDGIDFAAGVFTNLTQDHMDYHPTMEDYLRAKRRLFERLSPDAAAIINSDEPVSERMIEGCRGKILRYGTTDAADVRGEILSEDAGGSRFVLHHAGEQIELRTAMVGRHNVLNALAAAATALSMGTEMPAIRRGLEALPIVRGRLERVATGESGFDVFVDYAHTDDALKNVLKALRPITQGRLCCVFGCGGDRDRSKRPLMAKAVASHADRFFVTSDNPRTEDPLAIIADIERGLAPEDRTRGQTEPDRAKAIAAAVSQLERGDTLVIAGKGHEDYQILGTEKIHFDDVEVAREAIAGREARQPCGR